MSQPLDEIAQWRRDYVVTALDGAIVQAEAATHFLMIGADHLAAAAFGRSVELIKLAAPELRTLSPAPPLPKSGEGK